MIDSGVYDGEGGRRLFLAQVERGIKQLLKEQRAALQKMSDAEIQKQLNKVKDNARRVGNERVLEVLSALELDDTRSLHEKLAELYAQINEKQMLALVNHQIDKVGGGSVNKLLGANLEVYNKLEISDTFCQENAVLCILATPIVIPLLLVVVAIFGAGFVLMLVPGPNFVIMWIATCLGLWK